MNEWGRLLHNMRFTFAKRTPNLVECALIILACMNFLGSGSIVFLVFGILAFFRVGRCKTNTDLFWCIVITCAVFVSSMLFFSLNEAIKGFIYTLVYIFGNNAYEKAKDKNGFILRTVLAIFLGFLIFTILTYWYNLGKEPEYEGQRILYSIWTQERMSVTLVGLLSSVLVGFSCWAYLFSHQKKYQLLASFGSVFVVLLNVKSATRTPFVLALLVYSVMLCVALFSSAINSKWTLLFSVVAVLSLAGVLYANNAWGVRDYLENSPLFARLENEALETGRWDIMVENFKLAPQHLWGGGEIEQITGKGAHFYLQQCYDMYGVVAAIPMFFLSVNFLRNIWKLLRLQKKNKLDMLFLCMYLSMLVQCCLEPVFTGYPVLFWSLLLIHGMANSYLKDRKRVNEYA